MAHASRPLIVVVVLAFVLVAGYLLLGQPVKPQPPQRSSAPFAPIESIGPARDASAASDEANRRLQAAAEQVDAR